MNDQPHDELADLPSVREEQRRLTRRRIVKAARQVFEQHGYGQASIGDITKAAKVNRATFYLHFTNKAAVFNEVYDTVRQDQSARYWSLLGHALAVGTVQAVRDWLDTTLAWWEDQAPLLPAIHEAMAIDPDVAALWKRELDLLADELHEYLEHFPQEQREERRLRVQLMMVQLDQLCFRVIVQKVFPLDRAALLDLVTGLWADSLGLVEPGQ